MQPQGDFPFLNSGRVLHTMMVERVSAETANMSMELVAVKASAKVVERVRSSEAVVQVAYTVLEAQRNRCSTRTVPSDELAGL